MIGSMVLPQDIVHAVANLVLRIPIELASVGSEEAVAHYAKLIPQPRPSTPLPHQASAAGLEDEGQLLRVDIKRNR
jgi:hypothetical protein